MNLLKYLEFFPVAFGGAAISGEGGGYGFGPMSESEAVSLLHYSYDRGIRIFDTAPIYGYGLSEKRMGLAFHNQREKVFLISKSGVTWHPNKRVNMTNDPQLALEMLENSLRSLKSDYIDLYMVHWPDPKVDIRLTMEVLSEAKKQGKIKHLGLCNTNLEDIEKALEIDQIEVVQSEFNFFNHESEKLFPFLKSKNISFMGWGPFDKGILTGNVDEKRVFEKEDARSWAPWWKSQNKNKKYEFVRNLKEITDEFGISLLDFALGYNLSHPQIDAIICGMRSTKQVDSVIDSMAHRIPHFLSQESFFRGILQRVEPLYSRDH